MVMQRKQKPDDGIETAVPAATAPSPEMSDRHRSRTFAARTKLRILAEVDSATGTGGIGAMSFVRAASVIKNPRSPFSLTS